MTTKTKTETGPVLKLTQKQPKFRAESARALWYDRFKAYNGKSLAAFKASVQKDHPSTPKHGKLAGKLEPVGGWLSYMTKEGYVAIK